MGKPTQWMCAGLGLSALMACMGTADAQTANVVQDNFTGHQATNSWVALGGACLTAGDSSTTVTSGIGVPACIGDPYYTSAKLPFVGLPSGGTAADASGSGALRLTNGGSQGGNEAGAIISTVPFLANEGIQVTFTTYTYGGNAYGASNGTHPGADGIGFYLIDASQYGDDSPYLSSGYFGAGDLGAFGGSLGYSCSNGNSPYNGMIGGYVGLGIDEYGNYLNYADNTNTGQTSVAANEGHQNPGEFGLRGPGSVNWAWLTTNYPQYYPSTLTSSDRKAAVKATCSTGTLWNYNTTSTTSPQAVQTSTAYSCPAVTIPGTTYADLNQKYSTYYPPQQSGKDSSSGPGATTAQQGLNDTCTGTSSFLYRYAYSSYYKTGYWNKQSTKITCSQSTTTGYSTTYANLSSAYPSDYPSSLSSSLQTQALQNTCSTGYVYDYSQYALPSSPYDTSTPVNDYSVIQSSVVTLPTSTPISSQEGSSSAVRTKATPITYKVIITSAGLLSFYYDYGNLTNPDGSLAFKQVMNQVPISDTNGTPPSSYLFGFGGSTGGGTNVHEITCFEASPAARTIGSPVAPLTVTSGSLLYTLTSNPSPVQGYVNAYGLDAAGNPSSTASWEAGSKMTDALRSGGLYSTGSDGQTATLLSSLDSAAFGLPATPTTCVPSTSAVVNYTVDPNTSYSATPTGCSAPYLGSRAVGSLLDEFSPGDYATLLNPPNDPTLLTMPGYATFAQTESKRAPALLFSNDDGFLYSVDASTGTMNWGWMPRSFVSGLQNYTTFPYQDNFAGKFAVADAYDTSASPAAWGSYVIGSAAGGALWYDLKLLDGTAGSGSTEVPTPSKVIATFGPYQATMPANTTALPSGTTVGYPQRQAPVVASIGTSQYAAFLVNASSSGGSTSTYLYEFNIATGASTNALIPASAIGSTGQYVTSNLFYDGSSGVMYFGTSDGKVYSMSFTGDASTDIGNIGQLGSTEDQQAVQFVGYQQYKNQPYLWATSTTVITVFGINNAGWNPLWASGPGKSYSWGTSGWTQLSSSTTPAPLQTGATISDLPLVVNGVLVVPIYVPPSAVAQACNVAGEGYYDFFDLPSGTFPLNKVEQNGKYLTANLDLGEGKAYSPSISISGTALPLYGSTQQTQNPQSPLLFSRSGLNTIVQWRIH